MNGIRSALGLGLALAVAVAGCTSDTATAPYDDAAFVRLDGADQGGQGFTTTLSGDEEAPVPVNTPGTGTFTMTINPGQGMLCYELAVSNLTSAVTNAHIHIGPPGVAGPPVVQLDPSFEGSTSDCLSVEATLLRQIRTNPAAYYVNVHTVMFGAGEVRGQLD